MVVDPLKPGRELGSPCLPHDHGAQVEQLLDVRRGGIGCGVELRPRPAGQCCLCTLDVEGVCDGHALSS